VALRRERHWYGDDVDRRDFEFMFPMIEVALLAAACSTELQVSPGELVVTKLGD
jgi:hypothetical protein